MWTLAVGAATLEVAEQVVNNTPAWLAFIGALGVALIAAATAQWRQRAQLRHDRELKDLDELRALLDECATTVGSVSQLLLRFLNRVHVAPRQPPLDKDVEALVIDEPPAESSDMDSAVDQVSGEVGHEDFYAGTLFEEVLAGVEITDESSLPGELVEHEAAYFKAAEPIFALYQRVVLRLGEGHEIVQRLLLVQLLYSTTSVDDILRSTDPNSRARHEQLAPLRHKLRTAHFEFLHASRSLVGSRIRESSPRRFRRG